MKVLRRLFLLTLIFGVVALMAAIAAGVLAGGVPYPDRPNEGHLSPPGIRRWLETAVDPLMVAGLLSIAASALALFARLALHIYGRIDRR